ncbi:hypothetical protein HDU81_001924 [Chytriomyces hyalinus]|nr:hypothetical protein HDU81_001924 [Chytriomyces hyalinus]
MAADPSSQYLAYWTESPESDPLFWPVYTLNLPVYLLGMLMNGYISFVILRHQVTKIRLDRIILFLMLVTFAWSSFQSIRYLVSLQYGPQVFWRCVAACLSSFAICIFLCNLLIAIERFVLVRRDLFPNGGGTLFVAVFLWITVWIVAILAIFATSPTYDLVSPQNEPQKTIWLLLIASGSIFTLVTMAALYFSCYRYASRKLTESLGISEAQVLQKRLVKRCIVMSLSLTSCYVPKLIYQIVQAIWTLGDTATFWFRVVSDFGIAADVVVAPLLVCWFSSDIRDRLPRLLQRVYGMPPNWKPQGSSTSSYELS